MILAVVTVLYGIDIIGADVEAAYVVYAFIAVYVIVSIVLEIIKYKDSANGEAVQLSHCLTITNVVNRSPSTCLRLLLALDLLQQLFQLLLLPTLPQIKRICHCVGNDMTRLASAMIYLAGAGSSATNLCSFSYFNLYKHSRPRQSYALHIYGVLCRSKKLLVTRSDTMFCEPRHDLNDNVSLTLYTSQRVGIFRVDEHLARYSKVPKSTIPHLALRTLT